MCCVCFAIESQLSDVQTGTARGRGGSGREGGVWGEAALNFLLPLSEFDFGFGSRSLRHVNANSRRAGGQKAF